MANDKKVEIVRSPHLPYFNHEITFPIGNELHSAFIQYGFFNQKIQTQMLHTHSYTEIHAFVGEAKFYIEDKVFQLNGSAILSVPKMVFHSFELSNNTLHAAFQVKKDTEFKMKDISETVLNEFFTEITKSRESEDYSNVVPYLSFISSYFFRGDEPIMASKVIDYAFLINEFFSLKYIYDIKLSDLSREMCLSEKQTHRLVVKHTGKNFSEELTSRRMTAADHLIKEGRLSLSEIAEAVGYQTYSGFWKAYKKFQENK